MPWTPEGDWRTFIGKGSLEDRDEETVVIFGDRSERVSFGEYWAGYQYIYVLVTQAPRCLGPTACVCASI